MKTKIRQLAHMQRILALLALLALVLISVRVPVFAQTLTQGYGTDEPIQRGMIIQLKEGDATKIEALSLESIDKMHGLVVDSNDAPVTLSAEGQKVFVATTGRFDALVNDQNGPISGGDYITISAIRGIGMKATDTEPVILGRAITDFDGKTGVISSSEAQLGDNKRTVNIGKIQIDIGVAKNPLLKATEPNLPEFLRRATEALAGKPVSPAKAYIGVVIFFLTAIIAGSLMYSGVRSGIISIGRNPLSRKSIIRGMIQVILTGLIIFISGLFGVYLLLKL